MTTTQKIIKYLALALAIFIIVTIFTAVISLFQGLFGMFSKDKSNTDINSSNVFVDSSSYIDINLKYASLYIKKR